MNEYGYDLDDPDTIDEILYGWEVMEDERVVDTNRWHIFWSKTVRCPLGVYYRIDWQEGATEYQECDREYSMVKVKPVTKTIITYVVDKD